MIFVTLSVNLAHFLSIIPSKGSQNSKTSGLDSVLNNSFFIQNFNLADLILRNIIAFFVIVLLPENLHTYFELSAQAWTLYKAP